MGDPLRGSPALARFWTDLASRARSVLMLDYDGTLAPFKTDRTQAFPYPGVVKALDRLMETTSTRVVIVSGRWTGDLIALLRLKRIPEMWGSHGMERRMADGSYAVQELDEPVIRALAEADAWAATAGYAPRSERKPGCLALHWRGLPGSTADRIRKDAMDAWTQMADPAGLTLAEFDGGIEMRAPGQDKGDAVRTLLSEEGVDAAAAFLGDDLTDEDAFLAMRGKGLSVLVRPEGRPTAADLWMRPPEELLDFLNRWTDVLRRSAGVKSDGSW